MSERRSKSDDLNLINFIAKSLHHASHQPGIVLPLWLCLDYKIRARYRREAQKLFEVWVLKETIAREKREGNIAIKEQDNNAN